MRRAVQVGASKCVIFVLLEAQKCGTKLLTVTTVITASIPEGKQIVLCAS